MPKKKIKASNSLFESRKNKNNQTFRKTLIKRTFIAFMLILFVLFVVYTFFFFLVSPSNSLSQQAKTLLTIPRDDLESTLVVFEGSTNKSLTGAWYVVHNRKNAFTMVYSIPPGVYMKDYLHEISSYVSVGELKYVGNRINEKREFEYVIWQLGNLTGMTPDAYIWANLDSLGAFSKMFGDVSEYKKEDFASAYIDGELMSLESYLASSFFDKYNFLKLFLSIKASNQFISGIDSSLSTFELLGRMQSIKEGLQSKGIFMLDLSQIWATRPEKQVSGRDISIINYSEIDQRLEEVVKNLKGRELEKEQIKIEVYNASEIDGLALRYSRKFENSGIEVVRYENSPTQEERTKIYVPKPEMYAKSLELVKKLLAVDPEILNKRPDYMTTGDIVVVIGKDIANQVEWK